MRNFCCETLMELIKEGNYVKYDPADRSFSIFKSGSRQFGMCIDYCPFCGKKLPPNLIDERERVIQNELGIDYVPSYSNEDDGKALPAEFKTDEWWKKRGL